MRSKNTIRGRDIALRKNRATTIGQKSSIVKIVIFGTESKIDELQLILDIHAHVVCRVTLKNIRFRKKRLYGLDW